MNVFHQVWPGVVYLKPDVVQVFPVPAPAPIMYPILSPALTIPQPIRKIWIVSYSWNRINNPERDHSAHAQLQQSTPWNIEPCHTVHCEFWRLPPPVMCGEVSGISRRMQEWLRSNADRAKKDVSDAVKIIIDQWRRNDDDVVVHTCCVAGTHRSVAAAEMIARKLKKKMESNGEANFSIVVNHAHRQRQPLDPY